MGVNRVPISIDLNRVSEFIERDCGDDSWEVWRRRTRETRLEESEAVHAGGCFVLCEYFHEFEVVAARER